jgi:hypothetical protein
MPAAAVCCGLCWCSEPPWQLYCTTCCNLQALLTSVCWLHNHSLLTAPHVCHHCNLGAMGFGKFSCCHTLPMYTNFEELAFKGCPALCVAWLGACSSFWSLVGQFWCCCGPQLFELGCQVHQQVCCAPPLVCVHGTRGQVRSSSHVWDPTGLHAVAVRVRGGTDWLVPAGVLLLGVCNSICRGGVQVLCGQGTPVVAPAWLVGWVVLYETGVEYAVCRVQGAACITTCC